MTPQRIIRHSEELYFDAETYAMDSRSAHRKGEYRTYKACGLKARRMRKQAERRMTLARVALRNINAAMNRPMCQRRLMAEELIWSKDIVYRRMALRLDPTITDAGNYEEIIKEFEYDE